MRLHLLTFILLTKLYSQASFHLDKSVQFSCSVLSDSFQPNRLQHARLPCPSPTPGAYSNSCPSSQWCHRTLILCRPLLLLPSIFPSIRDFSNESVLRMRWPKYWIFSYIIMTVTVFLTLIWGEGLGVNNLILLYSRMSFYISIHTAN